jgi:hypothetical protein
MTASKKSKAADRAAQQASARLQAIGVLDALHARRFSRPAHIMLRNVRSQTGYGKNDRYADALVLSVHPSRGLWLAGIEVKVQRSDWIKELKSLEKSAEIQRFCDYWWIATTPGIVQPSELPQTWGLLEVKGHSCHVVHEAPKLARAPLDLAFVCSLLRNRADIEEDLLKQARNEGRDALAGLDLEQMRMELVQAQLAESQAKHELESIKLAVARFQAASGVHIGNPWNAEEIGKTVGIVQQLRGNGLAQIFRDLLAVNRLLNDAEQRRAASVANTSSDP